MKAEKTLVKELKNWLKKPGNNKAKLAALLGYSSSSTITYWESNGIPQHQQAQFLRITGEKNESSKSSRVGRG